MLHTFTQKIWQHLFLEFWLVGTWFFAHWRHQSAVTCLEKVRQLNIRRGKKLYFQLSQKHTCYGSCIVDNFVLLKIRYNIFVVVLHKFWLWVLKKWSISANLSNHYFFLFLEKSCTLHTGGGSSVEKIRKCTLETFHKCKDILNWNTQMWNYHKIYRMY